PALDLVLEFLHLGTLPADDDARTRGVDRDPRPIGRALDVDPRDSRMVERGFDEPADLDVLVEQPGVAFGCKPARAPGARRTQTEAHRMRLLSYGIYLRRVRAEGVVSSLSMIVR